MDTTTLEPINGRETQKVRAQNNRTTKEKWGCALRNNSTAMAEIES